MNVAVVCSDSGDDMQIVRMIVLAGILMACRREGTGGEHSANEDFPNTADESDYQVLERYTTARRIELSDEQKRAVVAACVGLRNLGSSHEELVDDAKATTARFAQVADGKHTAENLLIIANKFIADTGRCWSWRKSPS
jgi:hypothetical protein